MTAKESKVLMNSTEVGLTFIRLCNQLIENHGDFSNTAIIALQPRGTIIANRLVTILKNQFKVDVAHYGQLDVTFFRDDFSRKENPIEPNVTEINFLIEDLNVVLVDDVLFSGRTVRAGLDALTRFGRPKLVELLTLIDRRFTRELPIQANYIGKYVDTVIGETVSVKLGKEPKNDEVILFNRM